MDLRKKLRLYPPMDQENCGNCNIIAANTTIVDRLGMFGIIADPEISDDCDGDNLIDTWKKLKKKNFQGKTINKVYYVSGEKNIMRELSDGGPLCCCFDLDDSFIKYFEENPKQPYTIKNKIKYDKKRLFKNIYASPFDKIIHAAVLVGWDNDNWIVRNSWGQEWGDNGYFRIQKGINFCRIEEAAIGCTFN